MTDPTLAESIDQSAVQPLTDDERAALEAHEAVIQAGRDTFFRVGTALAAIREARLYRESYSSFGKYLEIRWGFSRQRAHQLIEAAAVVQNLSSSTTNDIGALNERHTRALSPLGADEQRIVYRLAKGTAPNGEVTSRHLTALAAVAKEVIATGVVDDGHGRQVPWDELTPERKGALIEVAVGEEVYERHQRQRSHIHNALASRASAEWCPPREYIDAVREVLGSIDVDPVSSEATNAVVNAETFFPGEDGLQHDWAGTVYLHPPHGTAGQYIEKLMAGVNAGITTAAIVFLDANAVNSAWFRDLWPQTLCFVADRIQLESTNGDAAFALHPSVFVYLGPDPLQFANTFKKFGHIVRVWPPEVSSAVREQECAPPVN